MTRVLLLAVAAFGGALQVRAETPDEAKKRHERVAERRAGAGIICHRGASEHAQENTLEAFRATFLLGGDGNEIDIRMTLDGVLVVFHDDMLTKFARLTKISMSWRAAWKTLVTAGDRISS